MQRSERLKAIIRAVETGPRRIADLTELTGASAVTVRRDLADLAERGVVVRTRGGAAPASLRGADFPFGVRRAEHSDIKHALASFAAGLVRPGQSVLIDNGTTALAVAEQVSGYGVTALALSLHAAAALARRPGNEVTVPGGVVAAEDLSFTGIDAERAVRNMRFDIAFLGACAADPAHGLTVARYDDARVKRAVLGSATRRVLVATPEKFTRTAAHRFGTFSDIDTVVTSDGVSTVLLHELRGLGVEIVTVPAVEPVHA